MPDVLIPLPFEDLPTAPPLTGRVRVSEEVLQTISLAVGWDGASRRFLRCTKTGILQTINPLLQGFINITGVGANYNYQDADVYCTEVVVRAHPDNTGRVWVNAYAPAAADTGWPLDAGEYVPLTVLNLSHVHLLIVVDGEKVILEYTL